jgi:hypothetical protein
MARRKMPAQKPAESKQDYETPDDFIRAVELKFGDIDFDLAADTKTCKVGRIAAPRPLSQYFYSKEDDSLNPDNSWAEPKGYIAQVRWLNPEFGQLEAFTARCAEVRGLPSWTVLLAPAGIGTRWFERNVLGKAMVWGVPRFAFVGETHTYPKDLMVAAFGYGVSGLGFWDWRADLARAYGKPARKKKEVGP